MDENKTEADQAQANVPEPSPAPAGTVNDTNVTGPETSPTGPSFRERMAITLEPARKQLGAAWNRVGGWLSGGNWVYGLIGLLVVAALLLPPISLPRRLGLVGFTRLNANNPTFNHPDGLTVRVIDLEGGSALAGAAGGGVESNIRINVTSIPRLEFMEGNAGSALVAARDAIPPVLELKSPYYQIEARGSGPATLEVLIPNDAEPWMTLDLYSWNGSEWNWIGGLLDQDAETLILHTAQVPQSLAVMQTSAVVPAIGTTSATHPEGAPAQALTQIAMPGLYLGTDGALLGQAPSVADANPESLLLICNWQEGQLLSLSPLTDLLNDRTLQESHIAAIVGTATEASATGVALDYRGVSEEQEASFVDFVAALAEALHAQNVRLEVRVPAPLHTSDGWDTTGYDWTALGKAADAILVPFPSDPAAYGEEGEVEDLLHWAVSQVNRYKLRPVVSSLNIDTDGEEMAYVGLEEALAPFGQIQPPSDDSLEPGAEVVFTLAGQVTSIMRNEAAGTYSIAYRTENDGSHTVWLGTPSFLARKLDWALRYHLGGVVIEDILNSENMPGVLDAVTSYRNAADQPQPAELEVEWTVDGPESSAESVTLSQPDFRWTAPSEPGTYTIAAVIAGVDRGSVAMTIASPEPTPSPTPTSTLTATVDAEAMTDEEAACLQATFLEDVTVPDGTHFEKGETFVKTWKLRNSGTCDWPEDTVLVLNYSDVGGPETHEVGAVPAGDTVEISIELTAPDADGNFDGLWNLMAGDREIPGGSVTAVIQAGEMAAADTGGGAATVNAAPVSGSFELGGHVRDLSMPYADTMHYAGMNWSKVQVHYSQDAAGIIAAAHNNGFKIQLSALGGPSMVTQAGFEQNFANWVAGLAAAGADAIEIWNEPNIDREWQVGHISPQAYTNLLCTSYEAIKAANPGTLVISAAPAPTGWFGGCGPNGCDDQPWLEGLAAAGAANCMDYIGAHHNSGATSPSATIVHPANPGDTHHSWFFLPQTQLYYNIFGGTRQLFYTEMGYASQEGVPTFSDEFAWARGTDNSEQAAWLAEAVQLGINTGTVRCIIVWNIDFARYGYDPQDGYAIIRPGGSCPACDSLHAVLGTR